MSFLIVFKLFQTNLIIVKLEKLLIEKKIKSFFCSLCRTRDWWTLSI